jgi:tungstate transport system substrate-binding protein
MLALVAVFAIGAMAIGCGGNTSTTAASTAAPSSTVAAGSQQLILASTTSTQDSGLFDVLIPAFEKAYPQYKVKVVAVGSGEALTLGQTGDADVLLVHSPAAEETFMKQGYGVARKAVMYNDPAKIKGMTSAADAFAAIAKAKALFYTRGDNSGTYTKELSIWKSAKITPSGTWYQKTGQGMGETLTISDQKSGYTLSDRATYLSKKSSLKLEILVQGDTDLFNQYHVITCKKAKNVQGGNDFMNWIVSPTVQNGIIASFGKDTYGQALFTPNAATAK